MNLLVSPVHRWGWTWTVLRLVAGIQALLVLTQAFLAGQFLTGNPEARALHETLGSDVVTWTGLAVFLAALLAWRPGQHRLWPVAVTALGIVALIFQLRFGFGGQLAVHIPLGVAIFGFYLAVALAPHPRTRGRRSRA